MRVFVSSGPPSRFDWVGLVGTGLGRAARFAPLSVVLVPPKNFLDHGIDDVIRVALDEPSVVFEEFVDRLLESYLPSHDPWCFLNDRHSVPPLLMCVFFPKCLSRGKNSRHDLPCRRAGATPRTFWAAESRKSGVAPARFGVFSTQTLASIPSLSPTLQRNCSRHRLKNLQKTKLKCVVLTLFSFFPQVPFQELQRGKAPQPKNGRSRGDCYRQTPGKCRTRSLARLSIHDRDARSVDRQIGFSPDCGKSGPPPTKMCSGRGPRPCEFGSSGAVLPIRLTQAESPRGNRIVPWPFRNGNRLSPDREIRIQ